MINIQDSYGTSSKTMEIGSSDCISFAFEPGTFSYITRNENSSLCLCYRETPRPLPDAWNRSFSCSYSNKTYFICINEVIFSDAGVFARKLSNKFSLQTRLIVEGPPIVYKMKEEFVVEGLDLTVHCSIKYGIPRETDVYWMRMEEQGRFVEGNNLTFTNIQRNMSGTFICIAENSMSSGKTGRSNESVVINVQYPPFVTNLSKQNIKEGQQLSVICRAIPGNPIDTSYFWTREDNKDFIKQSRATLQLSNIQRNSSGIYICTAENTYNDGSQGKHSMSMVVNVLYKPVVTIITPSPYIITEGENATLQCSLISANPNNSISWKWFFVGSPNRFLYNQSTFTISNIQRTEAGSYSCTAKNTIDTSEASTIDIDVQYAPRVLPLTQQNITEGNTLTVGCKVMEGNPNTSKVFWTRVGDSTFHENSATLQLFKIQRNSSGFYKCTAENMFNGGKKGKHSRIMFINVLYKPMIVTKQKTIVDEDEHVTLYREIDSNPLSNVTWYVGSEQLKSERSVENATFTIEKAMCTNTQNYTLVASNTVESNVTALVELIVNCKPRSCCTNITLGVTDATGIEFSVIVVAYPEPQYELQFENGTINNQMTGSITSNSVNNFTIQFNQTDVEQSDYGTYRLKVNNSFGYTTLFLNVIPQRKPNMPNIIEILCEVSRAKVQWTSSFNGGDPQLFTVHVLNHQFKESRSENISDKGEKKIHFAVIQNLQPSMSYLFHVTARNSHGFSSSDNISCTTLEESGENLPLIVGVASAGGISLAVVFIFAVVFLRRLTMHGKQARKSQRFKDEVAENEDENDDGMKDNILYVSAGPKVDENPEAAVYAAVNKKAPESNNNANVYAEVNKSGNIIAEGAMCGDVKPKKGLFKKDVNRKKDGNPKQKKGKKQKNNQDVADVYENSEDIPMSFKTDNVYSNAGQKVQNKEERGYKNKDGLLYVEVKFDAKTEKGNQTIHGEDEKTDYATVEFPMAASTHNE